MEYKRIWTDDYTIHSYESDKNAKATPIALLQFMQESAWKHAEHLDLGLTHLSPKGLAWVLARLSLKINSLPEWHEKIVLETWPSGLDRLLAHRDFRISSQTNQILAVGSTSWLVIDVERRRPQKTSSYFYLDQWDGERVFPRFTGKVPPVNNADPASDHQVYYSHLDVNGHVNNVKYLEFVLDSLPMYFLAKYHLSALQMNFLAEALYGDTIEIKTQENGDLSYLHSLYRKQQGDELCRLNTIWEKA